jgi:hypothetical protein
MNGYLKMLFVSVCVPSTADLFWQQTDEILFEVRFDQITQMAHFVQRTASHEHRQCINAVGSSQRL